MAAWEKALDVFVACLRSGRFEPGAIAPDAATTTDYPPTMVVEKPIIDTQEILRALDPIHGRARREFGELRQHKLLTTGVAIRSEQSAPGDAFTLYCSLNRDTISALRHGDTGRARELRQHAQRIEQDTLAPWLMEIAEGDASWSTSNVELSSRADTTRTWLDRALYAQHVDEVQDVPEPIWTAVNEVADVRRRYTDHDLGSSGHDWARLENRQCPERTSARGPIFGGLVCVPYR